MEGEVKLFANPVLPAPNSTYLVKYLVSLLRDTVLMERRPRDVLSGSTELAKVCGVGGLNKRPPPWAAVCLFRT